MLSYTSAILEIFYFNDFHDYFTLENSVAPRDGQYFLRKPRPSGSYATDPIRLTVLINHSNYPIPYL